MLQESRVFKPDTAFAAAAHVPSMAAYRRLYAESIKFPDRFWGRTTARN